MKVEQIRELLAEAKDHDEVVIEDADGNQWTVEHGRQGRTHGVGFAVNAVVLNVGQVYE